MSTSSQLTATLYLHSLKELLKKRGVTYSDLAESLRCSLPTIKRSLNKTTLPLERLLEIAEVAGIPFVEICNRAEEIRPQHYLFTPQQDALFAERPELLDYLGELLKGKAPNLIAREHDLDVVSINYYQKHLEEIGLLRRKARGQVKLLVQPPVGFGPGSRCLGRKIEQLLTSVLTSVVHADTPQADRLALIKPLSLTREDYRALIEDLKRLIDQYSAVSERRVNHEGTLSWQIALATAPGPGPESIRLPRITC